MPALAWMVLIFVGSTDVLSAEHTSRFLVPFLHWLSPDISIAAIISIQTVIRKLGHVTEYAILAVLLWRALRSGQDRKMWILFFAVWIACALFAASDEFHQSFVPSRTASAHDVMIDTCGALIGLLICLAFARMRTKKLASAPLKS
jgi:VanZ family protein